MTGPADWVLVTYSYEGEPHLLWPYVSEQEKLTQQQAEVIAKNMKTKSLYDHVTAMNYDKFIEVQKAWKHAHEMGWTE